MKSRLGTRRAVNRGGRGRSIVTRQLKETRENAGMTQLEAAAILEVPARTYQSWENGTRTPSGPALKLIHLFVQEKGNLGSSNRRRRYVHA